MGMRNALQAVVQATVGIATLAAAAAAGEGCFSASSSGGTAPSLEGGSDVTILDGGGPEAAPEDSSVQDTASADVPANTPEAGADAADATAEAATDAGGDAPDDVVLPCVFVDGGIYAADDAAATDPTWALWPMPNPPNDVAAGAPNPETYTVGSGGAAGTVVDDVTGLWWEVTPTGDAGAFPSDTLAEAEQYCSTLCLAGRTDWRLPTVIELISLLDFSGPSGGPLINATAFPGTVAATFWSSTPAVTGYQNVVDFGGGITASADVSSAGAFRCVRGGVAPFATTPEGAPAGRYTVSGGGPTATVYDTQTKLTWQQTPTSDAGTFPKMTQAAAESYCASVVLGAGAGRLPTVNELLTLVDYSAPHGGVAVIDATAFPGTPAGFFYTSTLVAAAGAGRIVNFYQTQVWTAASTTTPEYFRCVH